MITVDQKNNGYFIGIDEAGLGPVIGPLVVSGVIIKPENLIKLRKLGVKENALA